MFMTLANPFIIQRLFLNGMSICLTKLWVGVNDHLQPPYFSLFPSGT